MLSKHVYPRLTSLLLMDINGEGSSQLIMAAGGPGKLLANVHYYPGPLSKEPSLRHNESITGPPAQWAQLFASLHGDRAHSDYFKRRELLIGLRTVRDDAWHRLWETGFVSAVLNAVIDTHFCGYSKEELLSSDSRRCEEMTVRDCRLPPGE